MRQRARAMRERGYIYPDIARALGCSVQHASHLVKFEPAPKPPKRIVDPEEFRAGCRDGLADRGYPVHWTPERIVAALQREAKRRGRAPTCKEWMKPNGRPLRFGKPWTPGHRPTTATVVRVFGSWTAGLAAAGLEPKRRECKPTRCKRGHALAGENLYVNPRGERQCRACSAQRARDARQRRRVPSAVPPLPREGAASPPREPSRR